MTDYVQRFDKMSEDEKFAIISALGERTKHADDLLDQVMAGAVDGVYTVHIEVNGVEVHAKDFIARYLNAIDSIAERKASEMIEQKVRELTDAFQPIHDVLRDAENKIRTDLGVERDSWDY